MSEDNGEPITLKIDMENLYGSWKYRKITKEDIVKAVAKMNKNHEDAIKSSGEIQDEVKPIR